MNRSRPATRDRSRRGGFTLFEAVLVMVLVLAMVAVAVPAISEFMPGYTLQKSVDGLVATARKAHADAVLGARRYRLCVGVDGETHYYYLACEPDPLRAPGVIRPVPGAWGRREDLPDGVTLRLSDGVAADAATGEASLEFRPDGTATAGRIEVASGDNRLVVEIAASNAKVTLKETDEE